MARVVLNRIGWTAPAGVPAPKHLGTHTRPVGTTGGGAVWVGPPAAKSPSAEARNVWRYRVSWRERGMLDSSGAEGGDWSHRNAWNRPAGRHPPGPPRSPQCSRQRIEKVDVRSH